MQPVQRPVPPSRTGTVGVIIIVMYTTLQFTVTHVNLPTVNVRGVDYQNITLHCCYCLLTILLVTFKSCKE